jgi:hypothetical protein
MKYKLIINEMLVVYRNIRSLCGGCVYKRVDVMTVHSHNINTLVYTVSTYRSYSTIYNQHIMKKCYFVLHTLYFNNYILSRSTVHVILARHEGLPEDDVLTL